MKRQIRCKCGWGGPDGRGVGMCDSCLANEHRAVGNRVGWGLTTGEWFNLREGDVVKLIDVGSLTTSKQGFEVGHSYTVSETREETRRIGPVNRYGAVLTTNPGNMVFEFEYVAKEPPEMPVVKPPREESRHFTPKDRLDRITDLVKETEISVLVYYNGDQLKYQVNLPDETQTEVDTMEEVFEILEIIKNANDQLKKWSWI